MTSQSIHRPSPPPDQLRAIDILAVNSSHPEPTPLERQLNPTRPDRRVTARRLLITAAACGVAGDLLLRDAAGGINLAAYMAIVIIATGAAIRYHTGTVPRTSQRFLTVALLFTSLLVFRDTGLLNVFNFITAALAVALAVAAAVAVASPTMQFRLERIRDVVKASLFAAKYTALGSFGFLWNDAGSALEITTTKLYATRIVLRGAILAIGLTVVFGMLLSAGDPVFANLVALPAAWPFDTMLSHVLLSGFFAWPILGLSWAATIGDTSGTDAQLAVLDREWRGLNRVDVLAILGALNALFVIFVLVQIRVLFGGAAYVLSTTGLTMAEYARNGFFTLVATAVLVLMSLLVIDTTLKDGAINAWNVSRRLSTGLLGFVGLVLVSAAARMTLYVNAFGASTERFYCYAVMAWLSFVLLHFWRTVLRNRPNTFLIGALVSAWLTLIAVNVVNVEALVTRLNFQRTTRTATFDLPYARSLGSDAVPALVNGLVAIPVLQISKLNTAGTHSACVEIGKILAEWTNSETTNRSGWSLSRWRAQRAVTHHERALRERSCTLPATPTVVPPTSPSTTPAAPPTPPVDPSPST